MSLIEKIYCFIKFPKRIDEDTFLAVLFIFCICAGAGWGILANVLSGVLFTIPWWVIVLSVLISIICYVVWYYVEDTLMHFLYAFAALVFSGAIVIVLPITLLILLITSPIWIKDFINFWRG